MPGPCSGKNLISISDYIQKRRDHALLFSSEYNLLSTKHNHFAKKDSVFGIHITKLVHNCLDMKQHLKFVNLR